MKLSEHLPQNQLHPALLLDVIDADIDDLNYLKHTWYKEVCELARGKDYSVMLKVFCHYLALLTRTIQILLKENCTLKAQLRNVTQPQS